MWAAIVYEKETRKFWAARDHIGICPLYWGKSKDGACFFSSELKAINEACNEIGIVMPGTLMNEKMEVTKWYQPKW